MVNENSEFMFAEEAETEDNDNNKSTKESYTLLIVDDEPDIHQVTTMALKNFDFEGHPLNILHAYSGQEAKKLLTDNPDIAVVLLDVVMESDDAGLLVADWIRKTLNNDKTRIVLRTGQSGNAPEEDVIVQYDIHDYKEKTELTHRKLHTLLYSCLRAYRDLQTIARSCTQLEEIIKLSESLFQKQSLDNFCKQVLKSLYELLNTSEHQSILLVSSFQMMDYNVIHSSGRFSGLNIEELQNSCQFKYFNKLSGVDGTEYTVVENKFYCCLKRKEHKIFLFIEELSHNEDIDHILLKTFMNYVSVGYDHYFDS